MKIICANGFMCFHYICNYFLYLLPIIRNLFDKFYSQKIYCKKQQYIFYNSLVEN